MIVVHETSINIQKLIWISDPFSLWIDFMISSCCDLILTCFCLQNISGIMISGCGAVAFPFVPRQLSVIASICIQIKPGTQRYKPTPLKPTTGLDSWSCSQSCNGGLRRQMITGKSFIASKRVAKQDLVILFWSFFKELHQVLYQHQEEYWISSGSSPRNVCSVLFCRDQYLLRWSNELLYGICVRLNLFYKTNSLLIH